MNSAAQDDLVLLTAMYQDLDLELACNLSREEWSKVVPMCLALDIDRGRQLRYDYILMQVLTVCGLSKKYLNDE